MRQHLFFHLSVGPVDAWTSILNVAVFRFSWHLVDADGAANDR